MRTRFTYLLTCAAVVSITAGLLASVFLLFVTILVARQSEVRSWSMDDVGAPLIVRVTPLAAPTDYRFEVAGRVAEARLTVADTWGLLIWPNPVARSSALRRLAGVLWLAALGAPAVAWLVRGMIVRLTDAWGGPIDISPDHVPQFGSLPGGHVHYAFGYSGNGVAPSHLGGRIIAHGTVAELRTLAGNENEELTSLFLRLTGGSGLQEIDEVV